MNMFRTMVVVAAIGLNSNVNAFKVETTDKLLKKTVNFTLDNKHTLISVYAAKNLLNKKDHFKNALAETAGFMLDYERNAPKEHKICDRPNSRQVVAALHLGTNYSVRKGTEALNRQGITLETIGNKVDILPAQIGTYVNPVVKQAAELATEPEVLTFAAVSVYVNYVAPYIVNYLNSNSSSV